MRYFLAALGSESHSASSIPTDRAAFAATCLIHENASRTTNEIGALLRRWRAAATQAGHEIIEGLAAFAEPGAPIAAGLYQELRDTILSQIDQALSQGPIHVLILMLHGALLADGHDDCEGDLLGALRGRVGEKAVIGASLDLHAILTPQMVRHADVLLSYQEYPHIDVARRMDRVFQLCTAAAERRIAPVMAVYDCRMAGLWPTTRPPLRELVDALIEMEQNGSALAASFIHGFPWSDSPHATAKVLMICDGDRQKASTLASEFGQRIWQAREKLAPDYVSPDAALDTALRASTTGRPAVIVEVSDNPGAGASATATQLIERARERRLADVLIGLIWDPQAALACGKAGLGALVDLQIGGRFSMHAGSPLNVKARVVALSPPWIDWPFGNAVGVEWGGITLLISSRRRALLHPAIYQPLGLDPRRYRILIVKAAHHAQLGFAPIASQLILCNGRGDTAADFTQPLGKVLRPYWPADPADAVEKSGAQGLWD